MNRIKSNFKRLTWLFMAFLMTALVAGCGKGDGTGHWNSGAGASGPTVTATVPLNGATIVPVNTKITATFSEAMAPATINGTTFTLVNSTLGGTPVAGSVSYDVASKTAVFTPTTPATLPINTRFTATITTGAKNPADTALANNHVWTFTTGATADITAPSVIATAAYANTGATSGGLNLPTNRDSTATFSEAMDPATINGTTYKVVNTTAGGTPVAGVVSYLNNIATFTPIAQKSVRDGENLKESVKPVLTAIDNARAELARGGNK